MNFVFISPNFPDSYYLFCRALIKNGVRVLGITDTYTEDLTPELKQNLTDHYRVANLSNLDQKIQAIHYFISKYGPIDFIESNNEYWLDDDAKLREIFGVKTGPDCLTARKYNRKSLMKDVYATAGVKSARWILATTVDRAEIFAAQVDFPLVAKPDHGVGASHTYLLKDYEDLKNFFVHFDGTPFIIEEYLKGELLSYDGIVDSKSRVVYAAHHVFPTPIMEIVNGIKDVEYFTSRDIPNDLALAGQKTLAAFQARSRFFHLEFFRLSEDRPGLACKGELIGLEVNMRVPGGYTPDMIDYAYSIDIYQIWADVISFDCNRQPTAQRRQFCLYIGRRDGIFYRHGPEEIRERYGNMLMKEGRMPSILSEAMGNYYFIFRIESLATLGEIRLFALKRE